MKKTEKHARSKRRQFTGALGLPLPRSGVRILKDAGIYANSTVQVVHQDLRNRYVVRGLESGGATVNVGRYVTFTDDQGTLLEYLQPVEAFGVNGLHAVVVAESFVRVEMVRNGHTYDLLITHHAPEEAVNQKKPGLRTRILFRGHRGRVELDLTGRDKSRAGSVEPTFLSLSLEPVTYPPQFRSVVEAITKAVNCLKCSHSHYVRAPQTQTTAAGSAAAIPEKTVEVAL